MRAVAAVAEVDAARPAPPSGFARPPLAAGHLEPQRVEVDVVQLANAERRQLALEQSPRSAWTRRAIAVSPSGP